MMKKILLIPDSFKGTLSSRQVCRGMAETLSRFFPEAEIREIPVADGGEGSVDAFLAALGGEKRQVCVKGPFFEEMQSSYGVLADGTTAVIEMAACAGLPLLEGRLDPERASTYGVGQMMVHAVESGCTRLILGLGGSCTNDGGAGAAAAAGAHFFREDGSEFIPVGGTLGEIARVENTLLQKRFQHVEICAMCDVDTPLYGKNGAAYVFGPQKGADQAMIERLDQGLRHYAEKVKLCLGCGDALLPGAGAAGGMGFGMASLFGASLQSGIETVLNAADFDALLQQADLVFTGEGRIDGQSVRGKVVSGVVKRAKRAGKPVIALVGEIGTGFEPLYNQGLTAVFSINRSARPFSEVRDCAGENLALTVENVARLIKECASDIYCRKEV